MPVWTSQWRRNGTCVSTAVGHGAVVPPCPVQGKPTGKPWFTSQILGFRKIFPATIPGNGMKLGMISCVTFRLVSNLGGYDGDDGDDRGWWWVLLNSELWINIFEYVWDAASHHKTSSHDSPVVELEGARRLCGDLQLLSTAHMLLEARCFACRNG